MALRAQGSNVTYRPLDTEQTEQECNAVIPSPGLVQEARRAKYVGRRVHLGPGCRRKEHDDDDWKKKAGEHAGARESWLYAQTH